MLCCMIVLLVVVLAIRERLLPGSRVRMRAVFRRRYRGHGMAGGGGLLVHDKGEAQLADGY